MREKLGASKIVDFDAEKRKRDAARDTTERLETEQSVEKADTVTELARAIKLDYEHRFPELRTSREAIDDLQASLKDSMTDQQVVDKIMRRKDISANNYTVDDYAAALEHLRRYTAKMNRGDFDTVV